MKTNLFIDQQDAPEVSGSTADLAHAIMRAMVRVRQSGLGGLFEPGEPTKVEIYHAKMAALELEDEGWMI
jgi:hypothetical protein